MSAPVVVLVPTDFNPNQFVVDPTSKKMTLAAGAADETYTAGAVISGDKAVMFDDLGNVIPADPDAATYVYAGIALGAAQPGGSVAVREVGIITASFWAWTPGLPIFAAPAGNLTQTVPTSGRSHLLGFALGTTTIRLDPEPAINIV